MIKQLILIGSFVVSTSLLAQPKNVGLKDTIKDNSIKVPEALESNLDALLIEWRKGFQKDNGCDQDASIETTIPDSVFINRLYSLPSEMELCYNPIVRSYIDMYTRRKGKSVSYMLGKGEYYFPMIEEVLDKNDLPLELKYLSVIESALNPVAKSRAGATGLWQFMLRTGQLYDLEINTLVDERKDPKKATEAAARYLKDMYDIYGDWNLVIAAYNCGPGNVNKAIKRSGGLTDYWAIYPYLPKETRGYVPAFIAATYVMNYYNLHNICPVDDSGLPVIVDTLKITQNVHLKQISDVLNIPIEDLRTLNPQYQKDIIPGDFKNYNLRIPSRYTADFIENENKIFDYKTTELFTHRKTVDVDESYVTSNAKATKTHKVKKGESLGLIARKYGVSVNQLKKLNNLKSNNIGAGKVLVIQRQTIKPKTTETKPVIKEQISSTNQENTITAPSDTVTNNFFAEYYKNKNSNDDVENNELTETNDVPDNTLNRSNVDDSRTIYHKVRIGETVLQIANKYGVESTDILKWNKLHSKKIKIGQRLMVKLPENYSLEKPLAESTVTTNKTPETAIPAKETEKIVQKEKTKTNKNTENKTVQKQPASTKKVNTTYVVKRGDSLSKIADKYKGVSVNDIKLANNLTTNRIDVGQKLNIPAR